MRFVVLSALLAAACGPKCPEPQYEGKASDEAWLTMVDAEQRATADAKVAALQLTEGMQLPKSPAYTFYWTTTLTSITPPMPKRVNPKREAPWYRGLFISEAYAHLPPVTGVIHWFKIAVPSEKCPVELLTTRTEWTPSSEIWTKLTAGTGARSITVQSAYLTENRITEGPFKTASPVTFTVAP